MKFAGLLLAVLASVAFAAVAGAATGLTTLEERIVPDGEPGFNQLETGPGEGYVVREDGLGAAQADRETRRVSLSYFGQLTDFQLADEESPARVEFLDVVGAPVEAAFRPWEALNPFIDDAMVRQVNAFAAAAPVAAGDGTKPAMSFTINTGDLADSQQFNETQWVRALLEGGALDPNSGIDPAGYMHPFCPPLGVPGAAEAAAYTGIQDYDDYLESATPYFYDPDEPSGAAAEWPEYPGLMDRAQQAFTATGLDVPSYIAFGNHDALVQGNQAANVSFELIATGCLKPMEGAINEIGGVEELTPAKIQKVLANPTQSSLVPPDPDRRYVSKEQFKQIFIEGTQADGHGFGAIDPAENKASKKAAGYYSFSPSPGLRMISVDTVCEGGVTGPCADGNVDDPQFKWLEAELQEATAADELVILYSHHAIPSLTANIPDESAPPCVGPDAHLHDANPGCDVDPRTSTPIHLGEDMVELLHGYPHVIAWVAGHSHVNDVTAYPAPDGSGGFWSIRVAAEADWPQQTRLLQLFDNRDGTLSIFGTIVDHVSPATAPAPGTAAAGLTVDDLASIGRTLSYNDHQTGGRECEPNPCGEGAAEDRNVELLIGDPRRGPAPPPGPAPGPPVCAAGSVLIEGRCGPPAGGRCSNRIVGTAKGERLRGTKASDLILGRAGNDRIRAGGGRDCVRAGRGDDRVFARAAGRDNIRCGAGDDVAFVSGKDSVKGCEQIRRPKRR